jgi:type I restriction enzyme R subunit
MKLYEPAMRHLIDTYISADHARRISAFDDMSLVDMLIDRGPAAAEEAAGAAAPRNVAETIENNVRRLIVEETPINPRFYTDMSALLEGLIARRRAEAISYADYLAEIAELARRARHGPGAAEYPSTITTTGARALYDNLDHDEALAVSLDRAIRDAAQKSWRGDRVKENRVRRAIHGVIEEEELAERVFELVAASRDYGGV